MTISERRVLIKKLEDILGGPVVTYITGDSLTAITGGVGISEDDLVPLTRCLRVILQRYKGSRIDNLYLFLYTRGGAAFVGKRIVGLISEYSDCFHVIVPYRCHSTGTHIILAAKSIITTPLSEFSGILGLPAVIAAPIQSLVLHPENLGGYLPCKEDLSKYLANVISKGEKEMFVLLHLINIKEQYEQMMNLTKELISKQYGPEVNEKIIRFFSKCGHEVFSRDVAKEIGLNVIYAEPKLEEAIMSLYDAYAQELNLSSSIRVTGEKKISSLNYLYRTGQLQMMTQEELPKEFTLLERRPKLAYIECAEEGYVYIGFYRVVRTRFNHVESRILGYWKDVLDVEQV